MKWDGYASFEEGCLGKAGNGGGMYERATSPTSDGAANEQSVVFPPLNRHVELRSAHGTRQGQFSHGDREFVGWQSRFEEFFANGICSIGGKIFVSFGGSRRIGIGLHHDHLDGRYTQGSLGHHQKLLS